MGGAPAVEKVVAMTDSLTRALLPGGPSYFAWVLRQWAVSKVIEA